MVGSKWEVNKFRIKHLDFGLLVIAGTILFTKNQSYHFSQVYDWLLLFIILLFGTEKSIWKSSDPKQNAVLFVISLFLVVFFQIEQASISGKHISFIDPLLIIYSGFLFGMVIWLLLTGKQIPASAEKYIFYAVFFKAYLYLSKLIISWYASLSNEFPWSAINISTYELSYAISVGIGILIPFVLFFPSLFKSKSVVKIGLYILLFSSVFEVILLHS